MLTSKKRLRLTDVNPHLVCFLCGGYYVDATTIVECLHSFCRSCIIKYLQTNSFCPVCEVQIHKVKPHRSLKPDKALQDIVYKLVPGLYHAEMSRRRDFYSKHPEHAALTTPEDRGVGVERMIYAPEDRMSICLEYLEPDCEQELGERENEEQQQKHSKIKKRYLLCPALVTISVLKKFIYYKYSLSSHQQIEVFHKREFLSDDLTLMDVAYIYTWKRSGPMLFQFRIYETKANVTIVTKEESVMDSPDSTPMDTSEPCCSSQMKSEIPKVESSLSVCIIASNVLPSTPTPTPLTPPMSPVPQLTQASATEQENSKSPSTLEVVSVSQKSPLSQSLPVSLPIQAAPASTPRSPPKVPSPLRITQTSASNGNQVVLPNPENELDQKVDIVPVSDKEKLAVCTSDRVITIAEVKICHETSTTMKLDASGALDSVVAKAVKTNVETPVPEKNVPSEANCNSSESQANNVAVKTPIASSSEDTASKRRGPDRGNASRISIGLLASLALERRNNSSTNVSIAKKRVAIDKPQDEKRPRLMPKHPSLPSLSPKPHTVSPSKSVPNKMSDTHIIIAKIRSPNGSEIMKKKENVPCAPDVLTITPVPAPSSEHNSVGSEEQKNINIPSKVPVKPSVMELLERAKRPVSQFPSQQPNSVPTKSASEQIHSKLNTIPKLIEINPSNLPKTAVKKPRLLSKRPSKRVDTPRSDGVGPLDLSSSTRRNQHSNDILTIAHNLARRQQLLAQASTPAPPLSPLSSLSAFPVSSFVPVRSPPPPLRIPVPPNSSSSFRIQYPHQQRPSSLSSSSPSPPAETAPSASRSTRVGATSHELFTSPNHILPPPPPPNGTLMFRSRYQLQNPWHGEWYNDQLIRCFDTLRRGEGLSAPPFFPFSGGNSNATKSNTGGRK